MDDLRQKLFSFRWSAITRNFLVSEMTTNRLWVILVIFSFCGVVVVGISALLTYRWAISVELDVRPPRTDLNAVSVPELRRLNEYYEGKRIRFEELLLVKPRAPEISASSGSETGAHTPTESPDLGTTTPLTGEIFP